jgi:hypothetical protein
VGLTRRFSASHFDAESIAAATGVDDRQKERFHFDVTSGIETVRTVGIQYSTVPIPSFSDFEYKK